MTSTEPISAARLLTADATVRALAAAPLDPSSVGAGEPAAALLPLCEHGPAEIGIWELTQGVVTDVETDEVFVVLAGRGTVTFSDGSTIALAPGAVVRLHAGDQTRWTITETLRKIYIA